MLLEKAKEFEENQEYEKAYTLYMAATNHEETAPEAYYRIGLMHINGNSYIEQDEAKGCKYLEMAYERGYEDLTPQDYYRMGTYRWLDMEDGIKYGLTRDINLALEFFRLTLMTELKNGRKTDELSYIYATLGQIMLEDIQNYEMAYNCFMAAPHDIRSGYYLAQMYRFGMYVERNIVKATALLDKIIHAPQDTFDPGDLYRNLAKEELEEIRQNLKYDDEEQRIVFISELPS